MCLAIVNAFSILYVWHITESKDGASELPAFFLAM